MNAVRLLTLMLLLLVQATVKAQRDEEVDYSNIADELLPYQDGEGNYEELYENVVQLLSQPVDLNLAAAEQLRVIPFLNEQQITQLIYYRESVGKLISIYELQAVPEFDLETINKILPLVKIVDPALQINQTFFKRLATSGNTYLIARYITGLERKQGFSISEGDKKFMGRNENIYVRFRSSKPGDFSFGFTADQDTGERFRWDPKQNSYGFDYISFHGQLLNKGRIKNLILGDYQCQFGQGLILGGGFGMGKGAETITTVKKTNFGFVPYTSINESGFMHGAATTIQIVKGLTFSGFYSRAGRDATIAETDSTSSVSSFLYTGLHRNTVELEKRKQVVERNYGGVIAFRRYAFEGGAIANRIDFSEMIVKKPNAYNQFDFQGSANTNISLFASYNLYNHNFFFESAKSLSGGLAIIAGAISTLHPRFDVSLLYRKFDRNYYTFYSNAFSETSSIQNETGMYWGWKYQWKKRVTASGYMDLFKFPWVGFRRYSVSSKGHEWLMRINYQPTRKVGMFIQLREESKERNSNEPSATYQTSFGLKRNYVVNVDCQLNTNIRMKTRAQFSTFSFDGHRSQGSVILQDLHFSINKFKLTTRYAIFDTETFDDRQYVYENDVWLAYSMPAYDGVGIRNFAVLQYKLSKMLTIWLRYARTKYVDRNEIGSGLETIKGRVKNDFKIQLRLTL